MKSGPAHATSCLLATLSQTLSSVAVKPLGHTCFADMESSQKGKDCRIESWIHLHSSKFASAARIFLSSSVAGPCVSSPLAVCVSFSAGGPPASSIRAKWRRKTIVCFIVLVSPIAPLRSVGVRMTMSLHRTSAVEQCHRPNCSTVQDMPDTSQQQLEGFSACHAMQDADRT